MRPAGLCPGLPSRRAGRQTRHSRSRPRALTFGGTGVRMWTQCRRCGGIPDPHVQGLQGRGKGCSPAVHPQAALSLKVSCCVSPAWPGEASRRWRSGKAMTSRSFYHLGLWRTAVTGTPSPLSPPPCSLCSLSAWASALVGAPAPGGMVREEKGAGGGREAKWAWDRSEAGAEQGRGLKTGSAALPAADSAHPFWTPPGPSLAIQR